ncbi:polar amino acid transport system permease protein [Variovorax boronicumulans]|uniref:Polar amino acid transport system permease protein n=1 Tax=Variovorax boronicumulans TaxID=436515 RepID=A0AAW8DTT5_9BURK|nr:amino acid ABC transporter permease [Variovorax boronicumulans]MDP9877723.1 polar amino acid transport system permease protein [Variovorax boronicumulans]MDP9923006.1 polar amino acid transport system permease protein [Variovorax boronicumulans]
MFGISIEQLLFIFKGAGWTLVLSAMGFVGGALIGVPLALARSRGGRVLRATTGAYVQLVQGVPLPVIMFVVYFGISISGFDLPALVAAGMAMTAYSSAYLGEIWKGCIQAVPRTQWEAAECIALRPLQRVAYVILPQAVRIAIAPTVGFLVQIIKNSSYAVVIGFFDLTYSARVVNNSTFKPFVVFTVAALIYFAICYPLSSLSYRLERRLSRR